MFSAIYISGGWRYMITKCPLRSWRLQGTRSSIYQSSLDRSSGQIIIGAFMLVPSFHLSQGQIKMARKSRNLNENSTGGNRKRKAFVIWKRISSAWLSSKGKGVDRHFSTLLYLGANTFTTHLPSINTPDYSALGNSSQHILLAQNKNLFDILKTMKSNNLKSNFSNWNHDLT